MYFNFTHRWRFGFKTENMDSNLATLTAPVFLANNKR